MELRQLTYFVAVAEELHFGRAAERLHIVQSAVSQQVRRLERELGAELFDRSPRRVRLTGAGERLLPEARAVLAAAERARAAVAPPPGLRIGTSTGLGAHLDRVLGAFAERAPDVPVELFSLPVGERLARVAGGQLDAAFVRAVEPVPGVRVLPLWPDPLVAAVPASHPLARRPEIRVDELAALPLALTERRNNPALVDLVVGACHRAGFEPLPGPVSGSLQDTLATIGTRPLWTVVYGSHARVLHHPRVAFVPFAAPGLALSTGLAVHATRTPPHLDTLLLACGDHEN
ncbi:MULTISPECIES: LysR family transcriptional regulator [unclassified Streptomyces]|uniref:LysR family transcriptional regulator n=1 Tax=unclassified Streptomyces TaxID=2593676 RepID=UPI001909787B|nr:MULTISPECIES: LysR family transcriptional regulator [unclassified Streptomyces]MBK3571847.1 LysR family transcriptional regulator [Streptomyces sp. MBT62]MBK6016473.1 LysR family transcriptional regulator [Streptomyces sp. MBT53]